MAADSGGIDWGCMSGPQIAGPDDDLAGVGGRKVVGAVVDRAGVEAARVLAAVLRRVPAQPAIGTGGFVLDQGRRVPLAVGAGERVARNPAPALIAALPPRVAARPRQGQSTIILRTARL